MIPRRAALAVGVATAAFGAALRLRAHLDPWLVTAAAGALSGAVAVWALGAHRLRAVLGLRERDTATPAHRGNPIDARAVAIAAALGVALVIATHAVFAVAAPWLGPHVRGLYASIDTVVPRAAQAAITLAVCVVEELVWRGCAFARTDGSYPRTRWLPITVALYAIPQIVGGEWVLVLAALGLGTVFTLQRARTGRLVDPLITHAIWSLAIFVVVPLAPP